MRSHKKQACPVCSSEEYCVKKKNNGLDLGCCLHCTLAYARPLIRGEEEDVGESNSTITEADFYEGLKRNYIVQSEIAKQKAPKLLQYWKTILEDNTGRQLSLLEIGCGTGQYYEAWQNMNVNWTGFEVNKDMLKFCDKNKIPVTNIDIMNADLDEKHDVVFLSQVLEHIIDPNLFIKRIRENIKEGGILHIDVPNHNSLSSAYRKLNPAHPEYGFLQPNHHLIAYTKESLSYLLKNNGFTLQNVSAYANNHEIFGQLIANKTMKNKIVFLLSRLFGRGSLLVAVATKNS